MILNLPFNLTVSEYAALQAAYKAGLFIPITCNRPQIKEVAEQVGMSYKDFSHLLSNACRKVLTSALAPIPMEEKSTGKG